MSFGAADSPVQPTISDGVLAEPRSIPYRPDLDGLRAIAVVAVVLCHAFPQRLPGGFAGVDIFFVISGFLICSLILKDLDRGEFSFGGFYARRIRRIFPSLILVLACSLGIGWCILTPAEWHRLASGVLGGAGFVTNLVQNNFDSYFDRPAQKDPVLHLWSLGIEEQFYLAFPVLLFCLWKLVPRVPGPLDDRLGRKRRQAILAAIALALVASFAFSLWSFPRWPSFTYFNPLGRMWELLAGAALACGMAIRREPVKGLTAECLGALGMLLTGASVVMLSSATPFPGWWTWLPVAGAMLLIVSGPHAWLNRRILAFPALVGLGLISYPLYLWHWPLLAFLNVSLPGLGLSLHQESALKLAAIVFSLIAAWLTTHLVERPFRFSSRLASAFRVRLLVAGLALVAALAAACLGTEPRLDSAWVKELERAELDKTEEMNWKMFPLRLVEVPSASKSATLMVGDSHMEHYLARVRQLIRANPNLANAVFATSGGCPPLPGMNPVEPGFQCPVFYEYWKNLSLQPKFSTVALSAFWDLDVSGSMGQDHTMHGHHAREADYDEAWRGLANDLSFLVRSGKRVVIFGPTPISQDFNPEMGIQRIPFLRCYRGLKPVPRASLDGDAKTVLYRLKQLATRSGVELVFPMDYLCSSAVCPVLDSGGIPIYRDFHHLRASESAKLATWVDDVLKPR